MSSHLERILEGVREDLAVRAARVPFADIVARAKARGPVAERLRVLPEGPGVIAEIKRASPSRGWIRQDMDAVETAREYLAGGAWAISVLTEERRFGGSLGDLAAVREAFPEAILLRKDFVVDEYMLAEARAHGADLVLLMVSVLGHRTSEMVALARRYALEPLVEAHDEEELAVALRTKAWMIGINNRNLATLSVDLATATRLLPRIPAGTVAVVESGISRPEQVRSFHALGARLFLVGESLAASRNAADMLRRYVGE